MKIDDEDTKKLKEELAEFNRYNEFCAKRGQMIDPKQRSLNPIEVNNYKKLCRAISPGIFGIYTYLDPAQSVGVIISFLEEVDDERKLAYIPIKLCDFVFIANQTEDFFKKILLSAKMIVNGTLKDIAPVSPAFSSVQNGAEAVIDLVKVRDEIKFLTDWVN